MDMGTMLMVGFLFIMLFQFFMPVLLLIGGIIYLPMIFSNYSDYVVYLLYPIFFMDVYG